MNTKQIFMASLLLASATVVAQTTTLKSVVVQASSDETAEVSCSNPDVSVQDTERLLAINDPGQSPALRKRLINAASEACQAGIPSIKVARGGTGRPLSWKAID